MAIMRYLNILTGEYELLESEEVKKIQEKLEYITFREHLKLNGEGHYSAKEIRLLQELYDLKRYKIMYDNARERERSVMRDKEHTQEQMLAVVREVAYARNAIMGQIDSFLF